MERIRFYLIPTAQGRIKWLKKHNKFAYIGEHVHYQPRKYPTDSKNIKIHNNVAIASNNELSVMISTNGLSPSRSKEVRKKIEQLLDQL